MTKKLIAITAVLVCLTGYQVPAQACLGQSQRMNEIEETQREIQQRQDCLAMGFTIGC